MERSRREKFRKGRCDHADLCRRRRPQTDATDLYNAPNSNFSGEFDLMRNGASANYNGLQAQFRHRFTYGLQTLLSYTWSHSIDNVSSDSYFANVPPGTVSSDRGSSTYDIRHTFSGAVSYDIPAPGAGSGSRSLETGRPIRSSTRGPRRR